MLKVGHGRWEAVRGSWAVAPGGRRPCTGSPAVSVKAQLATGASVFGLSTWVTVTSVSYIGSRHLLTDTAQHIKNLEQAYADLKSESQLSTESFIEQIDELEVIGHHQEDAICELAEIRDTLERQLNCASVS